MANLTDTQVKKIADLIRIHITAEELPKFGEQLETALDYANTFEELDTTDIPITSSSVGVINVFRDDIVKPGLNQKQAQQNAGQTQNNYIVIQRVIK